MPSIPLQSQILAIKAEMEPFAYKWAKVNKRIFELRFRIDEDSTQKELKDQLGRLKAIQKGDFADLLKVWNKLPESQWELTFQQDMRHLLEYKDLRKALLKFKSHFVRKSTNGERTQDESSEVQEQQNPSK